MTLWCAAHEAVQEAASREATMIVGGFSLCEACGVDALSQIVEDVKQKRVRTPGYVVAAEIARCAERGFL